MCVLRPLLFHYLISAQSTQYLERWTNETVTRRVTDGRQSFEQPVLFGALYHITMVDLRDNGMSDTFFEVTVHRDRNKRLTVTRYSSVRRCMSMPVLAFLYLFCLFLTFKYEYRSHRGASVLLL